METLGAAKAKNGGLSRSTYYPYFPNMGVLPPGEHPVHFVV